MSSSPSIAGLMDVRSSGILTDYLHSHEPCAPGAADYAVSSGRRNPTIKRKRMYQKRLKLHEDDSNEEEKQNETRGSPGSMPFTQYPGPGCRNRMNAISMPYSGLNPYGGNYHTETFNANCLSSLSYDLGYSNGNVQEYGGVTNSRGNFTQLPSNMNALDSNPLGNKKLQNIGALEPLSLHDDEDYSKFDRTKDWLTCFGASIIIGCVLGIIHSYAVFAGAIQHHYDTGFVEAVLVGCLCYFTLLAFIPLSLKVSKAVGPRWASIIGMLTFMLGLLIDALTVGGIFGLYFTHIVFLGIGGSLAYVPAMTICSDHFRKRLGYALTCVSCAVPVGTMLIYILSTLMIQNISYAWTKLCLAILVLVCTGASHAFPVGIAKTHWRDRKDKEAKRKLKACINALTFERDQKLLAVAGPHDVPQKHFHCVCVCDISGCDPFLAIFAGLTLVATCTIYIPYLFLISYAYTLATTDSLGLICCCCLASICTRLVMMNLNNHTFTFNRTVFQFSLLASGCLYISLNWADTFGWVLLWGLIAGGVEGTLCVIIPRFTLQTIPFCTLNASCRWMTFFHAVSVIFGPMLLICVYYTTTDYAPAMVALGIAQVVAAVLLFLMPNVEKDEMEELIRQDKMAMASGVI